MKKNIQWFTLIELLIVMTIAFVLMTLTFANYNYFQNVAKVKLGAKEISQSISEARNMAIAWWQKDWVNQKIGVYFASWSSVIEYHNFWFNSWSIKSWISQFKEKKLPDGVIIQNEAFIVFSSIFGTGWIYDPNIGSLLPDGEKEITISFKNSDSENLKKIIQYFSSTNTIDY